ncbi:MAG: hypothetical protein ACREBQ_06380, partial [Nitrososphaerales archaeon]
PAPRPPEPPLINGTHDASSLGVSRRRGKGGTRTLRMVLPIAAGETDWRFAIGDLSAVLKGISECGIDQA